MSTSGPIAVVLAILVAVASAAPYSKYGRSCKDIGCRSDEVCVMAEDPCSLYERDSCGRYPTCQRSKSGGSGESCTTKVCPTGQYCKTENGRPTCVNTTPALIDEMFTEDDGGEMKELTRRDDEAGKPTAGGSPAGAGNPAQAAPAPAGYPAGSGYPAGNPASAYPSGGGYPASSGYPSGGSGYPAAGSGYPAAAPNQGYPAPNQGYPAPQGYPSGGQGYPQGQGYPGGNSGYPAPGANNAGYQGQGHGQGQGQYPGPNPYNNNNPYGGYPQQGGNYGPPSTTKKPSITDKIASFAKNIAKQVLTQAIIDKVNGRN